VTLGQETVVTYFNILSQHRFWDAKRHK